MRGEEGGVAFVVKKKLWGWGEEKAGRENKCDRGAENVTKKKSGAGKKSQRSFSKKGKKNLFREIC